MVEAGWPHNDYSLLNLDEAREKSLQARDGRHAKLATDYRGIVFAWSKVQKPGYKPRHALPDGEPEIGTVVAHESGFAMVVPPGGPWGDRQLVFPGPHTNHGQPCGGYGCCGWAPYCDECQQEIDQMERDQWREYYSMITPLSESRSHYDDY